MTRDEFDAFCASLPATTHVVQWGGASVWKVGGKVFAIAPCVEDGAYLPVSFKASPLAYEVLLQQPGIIKAPYLSRGQWLRIDIEGTMDDDTLKSHITESHSLIAAKLTKKLRKELGLI